MKIVRVSAIPMSAPVPKEKRHRTDLGTKVKSDATLIRVETDNGLTNHQSRIRCQVSRWYRFSFEVTSVACEITRADAGPTDSVRHRPRDPVRARPGPGSRRRER